MRTIDVKHVPTPLYCYKYAMTLTIPKIFFYLIKLVYF